jgi:hypothetical protein
MLAVSNAEQLVILPYSPEPIIATVSAFSRCKYLALGLAPPPV